MTDLFKWLLAFVRRLPHTEPIPTNVRDKWLEYNQPFEGRMRCMYLDVKGLVTTGVGNLIDSHDAAFPLPWRIGLELATETEIKLEWNKVKRLEPAMPPAYYYRNTSLRLREEDIDQLVFDVLTLHVAEHRKLFSDFDTWPADAQLGALSRSWAAGTSLKKWPKFKAACESRDWSSAGVESYMRSVHARSAAQRVCFENARIVEERRLDPKTVYWPAELS